MNTEIFTLLQARVSLYPALTPGTTFTTGTRARANNVATIGTPAPHGLASGNLVQIAGMGGAGYNTSAVAVTVIDTTTFTFPSLGAAELVEFDLTAQVTPLPVGTAIWRNQEVEGLHILPKPEVLTTRPTGASKPKQRVLWVTYEIAIERVWRQPLPAMVEALVDTGRYVLVIEWFDRDPTRWLRRTFTEVTLASDGLADQAKLGSRQSIAFSAEEMAETGGFGSNPL